MLIKRAILRALLPVTTCEDSRYSLQSIQLRPDGKAVVTDGHVLLIATDQHPEQDDQFPVKGMPEFKGSPTDPVTVPKEVVEKLIAAMPKGSKSRLPILEYAQLGTSEGGSVICATDLTAACVVELPKEEQGKFPDYSRILKTTQDRPELTVQLAVEVLEKLIKAAKAIQGSQRDSTGGTIAFRIPTGAEHQGKIPLDHAFTFNGAATCIQHDTICDHEGCGRRQDRHTGEPDGVIIGPVGVDMKHDGIEITGCALPCRVG